MAVDQTEFFKQCVSVCNESIDEKKSSNNVPQSEEPNHKFHVKDSKFFVGATSIYLALISLRGLLENIRPQYLLANSREMSEDQKIRLDTEIKVKVQQLSNKIKQYQDAGTAIEKLDSDSEELTIALGKIGFDINSGKSTNIINSLTRNLISMGDYSDFVTIRNDSLRTIYSNIVKALALTLKSTLEVWNYMHDKRVERLLQLKKSTLSTSAYKGKSQISKIQEESMSVNMFKFNDNSSSSMTIPNINDDKKYVTDDYEHLQQELPQQQLQQLQNEQDSLAEELKKGTLDTVDKIEQSMINVAGMVHEIGIQLSVQNDSILSLDDHKDEIVGNVKSGNTVLIKANEKNSQRNKTFAWAIFIAALILLLVDYIL